MKKTLRAMTIAVPLLAVGFAGPAASAAVVDPELTSNILELDTNRLLNTHAYDLVFVCGVDGAVTFSGTGEASDVTLETISGMLDTTARTFTYTSEYTSVGNGYAYTVTGMSGSLVGAATSGTIAYTGSGLDTGSYPFAVTGNFANLQSCAPAPVVGNHGEYVSGAAKAGIKGAALAAIAKDKTKVGPYVAS